MNAAAIAAAKKSRFKSRIVDGQPVETTGHYIVRYRIGP